MKIRHLPLIAKIPLNFALIVPFIVQVTLAVSLVGYISYTNGLKAVNDLAYQVISKSGSLVNQHLDEAEMKAVNIHEGIDSTLVILNNRLKAKPDKPEICIIKEYGNLPLVECYPGQLNQVFMNILSNAIDALEERDTQRTLVEIEAAPSTIKISTASQNNWIIIRIIDNGIGISETSLSKLFDPFFTTKEVGKGTGLGLSISYQIITQKHHGKLYCHSAVGKGAEFIIEIPIR